MAAPPPVKPSRPEVWSSFGSSISVVWERGGGGVLADATSLCFTRMPTGPVGTLYLAPILPFVPVLALPSRHTTLWEVAGLGAGAERV